METDPNQNPPDLAQQLTRDFIHMVMMRTSPALREDEVVAIMYALAATAGHYLSAFGPKSLKAFIGLVKRFQKQAASRGTFVPVVPRPIDGDQP